jgi:hypothetical protein
MAPTPLLNATCVALETIDYLSKCSFIPPPCKDHLAWWKVFLIVIGTLSGVVLVGAFERDTAERNLLAKLWRMPTEKLPTEILEKLLDKHGRNTDMGRHLSKFKGRITSSKFEIDEGNNTKIITVVEDRSKIPSARCYCFHLPAECPDSAAPLLAPVLATEPAPASETTPVTVTTTVTTTTRTEVRRETVPVAESGSGGTAASGSSDAGTGLASSWGNDEDDAPLAYPY